MAQKETTAAAANVVTAGELGKILTTLTELRQPVMVWGQPGVGKSQVTQQVAEATGRTYIDIRALLMDPVDFRGIPTVTPAGTTRWATPEFLPPETSRDRWLINLEELPAAPPAVQASLYQLVLDRAIGEYRLPDGAALVACGNREGDRAVSHRMGSALASRFVHLEVRADPQDWSAWAVSNGIAAEVIFFLQWRPELLNTFDPKSREQAFACPRTWEFVSNIIGSDMDKSGLRSVLHGTVGEGPAIEFSAFLDIWRSLPHPQTIIDAPQSAPTFQNQPQTLLALAGALYRMADEANFGAIVEFAKRIRTEVAEFMIGSAVRHNPALQQTRAYISWVALNKT